MDRQAWLAERRAAVVADYDRGGRDLRRSPLFRRRPVRMGGPAAAHGPGRRDGPGRAVRHRPVLPPDRRGRRVAGVDQSAGMLAQARARGIAYSLEQKTLQELSYTGEFDAVMTVDAMENVPPEDWPSVLANLRRAVRPGGHIYMTVEEVSQSAHRAGLPEPVRPRPARGSGRDRRGRRRGLPLLSGPGTRDRVVRGRGPDRRGRGLQAGKRLGLPPLPAAPSVTAAPEATGHPSPAAGRRAER